MSLLQKIQALVTALTEVLTLTGQVQTALTDLDTFLDSTV